MKKTLLLLALSVSIAAQAEIVSYFAEGYQADNIQSAYNNRIYGSMCWGANASNIMGWWQDRLQEQGYTLPDGTPTGYDIYGEYKAAFVSKGGYGDSAIEWWLDGYYYGQQAAEGHTAGYYSELLKPMEHNSYSNEGTLIKQFFPATSGSLTGYSAQIKECLENGYALATRIPEKSFNITIWGADYDTETGLLTKLWYADPHDTYKIWHGDLTPSTDAVGQDTFFLSGMGTLSTITGISCHIEDYLTEAAYTDTGDGCFAPVYNVKLDGGKEYTLDTALASSERVRGDVTIVDGTVMVQGAGATDGDVVFAAGAEAVRTLSVQREGLSLAHIALEAADGNVLEVGAGSGVLVSSISGGQALLKTGEGTLAFAKHATVEAALTMSAGTLAVCGDAFMEGDLAVLGGTLAFADGAVLTMGCSVTIGTADIVTVVLTQEMVDTLAADGQVTLFRDVEEAHLGSAVTFASPEGEALPNTYQLRYDVGRIFLAPEPVTATLSLLALAGLASRRRRQ